jgi:hypothetical protein
MSAARLMSARPAAEIKVEEVAAVNIVKVEIRVTDLAVVAESDVENVRIATVVGEVTLNTGAIRDLITRAESQEAAVVEIDVEHKETLEDASLTEEQKAVLSDDVGTALREVYDVSVVINRSKQENFETQGELTIGLPYELGPGEAPEGVRVVHIASDGVTERMEEGRKHERSTAYFKTSHLSVYAVTYQVEEVSQDPPVQETEVEDPTDGVEVDASGDGGCSAGAAMTAILARQCPDCR